MEMEQGSEPGRIAVTSRHRVGIGRLQKKGQDDTTAGPLSLMRHDPARPLCYVSGMTPLQSFAAERGGNLLLAVAAPLEVSAVWDALGNGEAAPFPVWKLISCRPPFEMVVTGVGKASAAGGVARILDLTRHAGVISVGVAGALPGSDLRISDVVLATACTFADEGVEGDQGFVDLAGRGFPPGPWVGVSGETDATLGAILRPLAQRQGVIATVSTCSGADGPAAAVVQRTGAVAEAMEGAAVAATCARLGVPFSELRIISNHCGSVPAWDLPKALLKLSDVLRRLA
jgi:futalosine hydrolase